MNEEDKEKRNAGAFKLPEGTVGSDWKRREFIEKAAVHALPSFIRVQFLGDGNFALEVAPLAAAKWATKFSVALWDELEKEFEK